MEFGLFEPNKFKDKFDYITSSEILIKGKATFDPNGIFSEVIWPHVDNVRYVKLAAIDLSSTGIFLHPKIYETIKLRQKKLYEAIHGTMIKLNDKGDGFDEVESGGFKGFKILTEIISNLDKYQNAVNPLIFDILKEYKLDIFIQSIFVLPPALRDVQILEKSVQSTNPINNAYQNLIKSANNVRMKSDKLLKTNLSTIDLHKLLRIQNNINEIYLMQKEMLRSKEGFIRQNVLAKRIDFSARAVIAVDPKLPLNEVRLPYKIVMKLTEPFIGYHIFKSQDNVEKFRESAKELITEATFSKYCSKLRKGHGSQAAMEIIKKIIDAHIVGKFPALLKRDPSLHMTSWQAFDFTCTDDPVIYISPLIVSGFNADFDGDQMAVTMPITVEAQREVKEKMMNRFTRPGSGGLETSASQDVIIGMFMATKDQSGPMSNNRFGDVDLKNLVINSQINFNVIVQYSGSLGSAKMTYGNYIYNMLFRLVLKEPYIGVVDKKVLNKHLALARRKMSDKQFVQLAHKLVELSGLVNSIMPISIAPDELDIPPEIIRLKNKILEEEDYLTAEKRIKEEVMPKLKAYLKSINSGLYYMAESRARGSWSDIEQILVSKGYIADGTGKILTKPIKSSFAEGLEPQEVLQLGSAAAKGTQDRSLGTAKTGALSRELVFATQSMVIAESDCGTTGLLEIKVETGDEADALRYKFTKEFGLVTEDNKDKLVGKTVHVRSPIFCKSKNGICEKCYGTLWKTLKTKNVGIVAGQSTGERGTQLIMKTFHTGGKAESTATMIPHLTDIAEGIDEFITQSKQQYIAAKDIILKINMNLIDVEYSDSIMFIKGGVFIVQDANTPTKLIEVDLQQSAISYGIQINIDSDLIVEDNVYKYTVKKGETFGELIYTQSDLSVQIKYITNLFHGQIHNDDYLDLYEQLLGIFAASGVLSAHVEVIIAQMMRSKSNPIIPWRLNQKDDYIITSVKNVVFYESPNLAVGFQDINKAIDFGLLRAKSGIKSKPGPLEKFAMNSLEPSSKIKDIL